MADPTARKQRGRPFPKGVSGNPQGRPAGSRNAATRALETLLDGQAEALTQKAVELALKGDISALRICMDRLLAPRRDRPVSIALPDIASPADAVKASAAIASAISRGDITPSEASELSKVIDSFTRAVEIHEISERLAKLEQRSGNV